MSDYSIPKAVDYKNLSKKAQDAVVYEGRIIQPKWDGCALHIEVEDGQAPRLISASGTPVLSCDHLVADIIDELRIDRRKAFDFVADCEVWISNTAFQDISGQFRRQSPQTQLRARWFDFAYMGEEGRPYEERTKWMLDLGGKFAGHRRATGRTHAWEVAQGFVKMGGRDGAILRNPEAPYVAGRSKGDIIKLKPLLSLDLPCVGVERAVGEKTGRATVALVCKLGEQYQRVATGLSHEQQADPDQFIDQIIEVEAMGYTKDGLLREPRFKGARHDKVDHD